MSTKTKKSKPIIPVKHYPDCHGIDIDEVRLWLPGRVADWPKVVRVDDRQVCKHMHQWFPVCWNCGRVDVVEAHHIFAGRSGRSDEYTNIAMLCGSNLWRGIEGCHAKANTDELPTSRILWLKWKFDRQHTSWVRLCVLAGRFVTLECDGVVYG